jgi:hypothetical protein
MSKGQANDEARMTKESGTKSQWGGGLGGGGWLESRSRKSAVAAAALPAHSIGRWEVLRAEGLVFPARVPQTGGIKANPR